EIPPGFVDPGYGGLILEGQWIGVAICAVISVHHAFGYNESNHMVTAHICLGAKYSKIPITINFLAWPKTQIILYWTIVDDRNRIACPSHWGIFNVSFDVEPDSNFHVTKVGVRFIREEYIKCLKQHEVSNIRAGNGISTHEHFYHRSYEALFEDDTNLHQHTFKMVNFIFDYGCQQDSMDAWELLRVFDLFHSYKLPIEVSQKKPPKNLLQRILPKNILSRMPLENTSSRNPMDYISQAMLSRKEMAKISRIPITGVMCMMAVYMGDFEYLKEVKDRMSSILWQQIFMTFIRARAYFTKDGWFVMKKKPNRELHISDFSYNGILLQQLMNKMGPSKCFTKENKDEMMCVIDKLQNNIDKVSSIIQKMSTHADQYSHDIWEAQKYIDIHKVRFYVV
ncbi:hypothetical protein M8C21_023931, partial [Ambrosia artemisiifolia]